MTASDRNSKLSAHSVARTRAPTQPEGLQTVELWSQGKAFRLMSEPRIVGDGRRNSGVPLHCVRAVHHIPEVVSS